MPITPQEALLRFIDHREIFHDEMLSLFRQIMSGEVSPVMIAALLDRACACKKETIGEIAAAAQVMREFATKVAVADTTRLLDIVGTGGDGAHTFNISSTGACSSPPPPAPRGQARRPQRLVSRSGSADVLEALGVRIDLTPQATGAASPRPASASCSRRTTTRP